MLNENGYRLFFVCIIVGLCILMILNVVFIQDNGGISAISSLTWISSETDLDTLTLIKNRSNALSLFDQIISPPNQIPLRLNASDIESQKLKQKRKRYGGSDIDPKHLGGFYHNDSNSYERQLWEWAIHKFKIKSILDVGCGMGYSTIFFKNHPSINRILCIEGSADAIEQSLVPNDTIQHDYTLAPFWPKQTYDMLWCVEFLEHVHEQYMSYYMATFKKAKFLFVTAAVVGGWHHVNLQKREYWIGVFQSYGFIFLPSITSEARVNCPASAWRLKYEYHNTKDNGDRKRVYFSHSGLVFLNSLFFDSNVPRNITLFDEMLLTHVIQ